ncbi:ceramide-1-phosphate transfer protein isoform X1 [Mirounga leonina]|uniref:ceramide-1-phosphate transfer protein isoform X1 n=1 Tax=Mirounga leonina TaxID=9715 RepID=UPI00156C2980|nr:ceramide-1-phosphate transfer protein isoform X1 [Mirounga leonina]
MLPGALPGPVASALTEPAEPRRPDPGPPRRTAQAQPQRRQLPVRPPETPADASSLRIGQPATNPGRQGGGRGRGRESPGRGRGRTGERESGRLGPGAGEQSPTELGRFLNSLGAIFSFISKDVTTKLQIMEHLRSGPQREHYSSLQSMVAYEVGNQLVDLERRSRHPDSGCRTVLRLHRALRWLQLFLEGLRTSPEDARTAILCTDSYNASLAAYHPWIIRRAVTVAFCALPTRKVFLEAMNVGSPEQAVEMLGEALPFIEHVYNVSQKLYAEHSLLDLP